MEEKNVRIRFIVKPRRIKSVKNSSKLLLLLLLLGIISVGIPNKTSTVLYTNLAIIEEARKKQEGTRDFLERCHVLGFRLQRVDTFSPRRAYRRAHLLAL